jgi:phosphoribosylaminoimidazole carboxylase (NCAIR synthetase)
MGAKTLMRGGAIHSLDFRIRILDLRTDQPAAQVASNNFNPQSKIQNLKSSGTIGLQYFQSEI